MNSKKIVIDVFNEFSTDPWGRFRSDNPTSSGEEFRERFLRSAFETYDEVIVDFSKIQFTPDTSFLGESFVGLVKKDGFSYETVEAKLRIIGTDFLIQLVKRIINNAKNEMNVLIGR